MESALSPRVSPGASVTPISPQGFRLTIPAGGKNRYRLAQMDDYGGLPRRSYPHRPPFRLRLEARASGSKIPGTWGFGLWNAPFSLGFAPGRPVFLPALPNAAWFFHASEASHLSFRDDRPGSGFLAQVFQSARIPALLLSPAAPLLPLLAFPPAARLIRRAASRGLIRDDGYAQPDTDPTDWHGYEISWQNHGCAFLVDGALLFQSDLVPHGPLGIVLWIDNQFAAYRPEGKIGYGLHANPEPAWIEIRSLAIET